VVLGACSSSAVPLTPTPSSTPAPTATPLPTPTPTPSPADHLARAEAAIFNGDWDGARAAYDAASASGDGTAVEQAEFGKALLLREAGLAEEARSAFDFFLISHADGERAAQAHLLRGLLRRDLGDATGAVEDFDAYLAMRPGLIDGYVHDWVGDVLWNAGQPMAAADRYQTAAGMGRLDDGIGLRFKQGRALVDADDPGEAIAIYDELYQSTLDPAVRAAADWYAGQALVTMGEDSSAYARYLDAVTNYPEANESYLALVELVNADVPVDDLQRARIDVYAGAYEPAAAAYSRVLDAQPSSAIYYERALARRAAGDAIGALDDLFQVYAVFTGAAEAEQAWLEAADIVWFDLGDPRRAIDLLTQFVQTMPTSPSASEALLTAGRAAEISGDLPGAVGLYSQASTSYPASSLASRAALRAGVTQFRLQDTVGAATSFQRAGELARSGADRAAAAFWTGKVLDGQGLTAESQQAWASAAASDPTGFYAERAADRLAGRAPFQTPAVFSFPTDLTSERREAEGWLRTTFPITATGDLSSMTESLARDPRQVRGTELLALGLYDEARAEFEDLRLDYAGDAEATYRLMHRFLELGLYDLAIRSSRQVLDLAGFDDAGTLTAPRYFNLIRFGPYFGDLILPEALAAGLDPLFLLSVVRQESLFQGAATSVASARGLMQVIPTTGAAIAAELGWPTGYAEADLHRPIVSVRFGTHYLKQQRDTFGGDLMAALAAYNGGPGNAAIWLERAGGDADLFYEVIGFEETRTYLRTIYEVFNIYRDLYATGS
jgi:soluble lytic murein transglycosylase